MTSSSKLTNEQLEKLLLEDNFGANEKARLPAVYFLPISQCLWPHLLHQ